MSESAGVPGIAGRDDATERSERDGTERSEQDGTERSERDGTERSEQDGTERSERWVMHLDMDAFFASVEQLTRPTLRGRPVLVGGIGGRGVVAGASYAARAYGASSAMPMHQARRLVGASAVVLPPRGAVYRVVSERIFALVRETVGVIEMLSFDEAFAEPEVLVGCTAAQAHAFADDIRRRIRDEVGLAASVGFGSGKQIAKIASGMAKPDGVMVISPSRELAFLHALPVRKLWGIGPVSGDRLSRLGIDTIGDLAALSEVEVASVLGSTIGPALHRLAQGIDDRPVTERAAAKQISAESTFAADIVSMAGLRPAIDRSAADAHRRLVADGRGARTVVLKLKRADMSVLTRSFTLPAATSDLDSLTAVARRLALDPESIGPIRLVGVGYSGLSDTEQYALFDDVAAPAGQVPGMSTRTTESAPGADGIENSDGGDGIEDGGGTGAGGGAANAAPRNEWATGNDVTHRDHGHGWVQGAGHGVVTVRFETRTTGPGPARTFAADDPDLRRADPIDSLDWSSG
ncbi:DNA polymerase IV 1 [Gordonia polyisoprenivorans VH2]|uniref:DNA polymerase IV n=1 Tax=Gordonia polyisoprenivorans (strain DSM 44266 / VH2) TaxID=1112204 RepID=H6MRX3_GORPV|nr:DNA polymerase IV [Gordonia polyisoprenivorans]AFA73779.1 DNA polymerase IV 1 [Gordonia polyisoprenivorans VH2]OZC30918.1 DNA polymerase IV [Gordonia polyisoprenivorans]UZF54192.1 DNA polymerase IV [Gordonia polyisoprenivorans]